MSDANALRRLQAALAIRRLRGSILRSVSRSFYVSVKWLPRKLREPVALAYLLARSSDTIADTSRIPVETRAEKLQTLSQAIQGKAQPNAIVDLARSFATLQGDPAERALIHSLPKCFEWLEDIEDTDRNEIRTVLEKIIRGQSLDLQRFSNPAEVRALPTAADLDEYTYLVAGCVGEFWTRLCFRHIRRFTRRSEIEMKQLGKQYGMGLQLTNIIRDAGTDLRNGRCYFPQDELDAAHLEPADILREPDRFRPIYRKWCEKAEAGLEAGLRYSSVIRNRRVRSATALPALIGARTLALIRDAGTTALRRAIKVPRKEVRMMISSLLFTFAARTEINEIFRRSLPHKK